MTPGTREHHDGRYKEQLRPRVLHNILCRHFHCHCCYGSTHLIIRGNLRYLAEVEQADFLASGLGYKTCIL